MGVGNGVIVALARNSASSIQIIRSINGGVSWTNDQTVNTAVTPPSISPMSPPVWSAVDGLWYVAVCQAVTRATQIFSSPDAITWTQASLLSSNDCCFFQFICIGSLLMIQSYA